MPNFTPNSKIYIGRVPFDSSYRHTMTFASASAQYTYFASVCTAALDRTDYTYVRMNNAIRVPFNAETLYTYNYVMYQNANYGSKWFYAFIVGVNYINENCTELVLQLDVMQTWYFDYTLTRCFVEREHVNDDTVGAHINPEPAMDLEYIYDSFTKNVVNASNNYLVLIVTMYPVASRTSGGNYWYAGSGVPVAGDLYQNQYYASKILLFKMWNPGGLNQLADFQMLIRFYNSCGIADSIIDAFMVPETSIPSAYVTQFQPSEWTDLGAGNYPTVYTVSSGVIPWVNDFNIPRPSTINGYTPRNNKLLCYPYCYLEVGDFSGRKQDYRWEFFQLKSDTYAVLEDKRCGISDCQGYVIPRGYNGITVANFTPLDVESYTEPFTYDFQNKIPWMYSTYLNWAAQNQVVNQLAIIGSSAAIVGGLANGVSSAAGVLGQGAKDAAILGQMSGVNAASVGRMLARNNKRYQEQANSAFVEGTNTNLIAGGIGGIAGTLGNIDRMRRQPNTAKGSSSGNSRYQNGYAGWYYAKVAIRREFAEIVDGFFDMYGYQVDYVKIPNREGRTSWNYVKCQNSCHRGNVPADDMAAINAIYDKGITFWHTSDVGNYTLSNSIVTP